MDYLKKIFYPESIAVIGASENLSKWGSIIITNILDGGYKGRVYPISKNKDKIYGHKSYKSILDVDDVIDLVIITTPANTIMCVLEECVQKGIKYIVMVTSGFSETGEQGKSLESDISEYALKHDIKIVGPNTMGTANVKYNLYSMFSHVRLDDGGISIVSQSGNVGNQIMFMAEQLNVGISKFIGSGNEAVLMCEDYLDYLCDDDETSLILLYVEGVEDGRRFIDIAKRTTLKKPIIALKAGRTEIGSKAAQSHTGAMAGSYRIFDGVMKQCGIISVKYPAEMLSVATAFENLPLPRGNRVGVITVGGGWGVITADECVERDLILPPLPDDVINRLNKVLPPFWSKSNPVDLVGQPDPKIFAESIEVMVSSDSFDSIIFLGTIGAIRIYYRWLDAIQRLGFDSQMTMDLKVKMGREMQDNLFDNIIHLMDRYDKPIYSVSLVSYPDDKLIHYKEGAKYRSIIYKSPEEAVLCLEKQYKYFLYLDSQRRLKCLK